MEGCLSQVNFCFVLLLQVDTPEITCQKLFLYCYSSSRVTLDLIIGVTIVNCKWSYTLMWSKHVFFNWSVDWWPCREVVDPLHALWLLFLLDILRFLNSFIIKKYYQGYAWKNAVRSNCRIPAHSKAGPKKHSRLKDWLWRYIA